MELFFELDKYLSNDYSINYWEDEVLSKAEELVTRFSEDDWLNIKRKWEEKPSLWIKYFAQTLSVGIPKYSIPILYKIIDSQNDEISIIAIDSLRCIDSNLVKSLITPRLITKLKELKVKNSGINLLIINELFKKL